LEQQLTYRLESYEGPLDLLLTLIQKNKIDIKNIPIALLCDQYMEYIREAQLLDLELASEFIVMASELMLIKSKMLLPKETVEEEDPRANLADALLKYSQAKSAAAIFAKRYPQYSGQMVKDTDEISIDKSFVADHSVVAIMAAVRRIISYREEAANRPDHKVTFTPMISKPIVPVEAKIVGIIHHIEKKSKATLGELLTDSVSLPDMIAIFLGVLELIKVRKIRIVESEDEYVGVLGEDTVFIIGEDEPESSNKEVAQND
jgi:segregation and condensation protein A